MKDDLISRQAAIKAVKDNVLDEEWEYVENALKALPSAQQWIPVTKRLPEHNTYALLCWENGRMLVGFYNARLGVWMRYRINSV